MDEEFMLAALALAKEAFDAGEVPVGCVITRKGQIVGRGRNRREEAKNALAHAEIEAIAGACARLGGWRLSGCVLYVTMEPCPMCAGAAVNARIERVVFGAYDEKAGCCGSVLDLSRQEKFNHAFEVRGGVLEAQCRAVLQDFFRAKRKKRPKA